MESLIKSKWKSMPLIVGVFMVLVTFGCIEVEPITTNGQSNEGTYSGVQSVIITNSTGTLLENDREITANVTYPAEGEVEITLCANFDGHQKVCRLEGSITNNEIISVKNIGNSRSYTFKDDAYLNTSFEAFFGLSEFNLEDDCPEWSGRLIGDRLEISSNFCCDDPGSKDSATGKVSCSLVRM